MSSPGRANQIRRLTCLSARHRHGCRSSATECALRRRTVCTRHTVGDAPACMDRDRLDNLVGFAAVLLDKQIDRPPNVYFFHLLPKPRSHLIHGFAGAWLCPHQFLNRAHDMLPRPKTVGITLI